MIVSTRAVAALSAREKIIRIGDNLLNHPGLKNSPFGPMARMLKLQLGPALSTMSERDAQSAIDTLRSIIDA